MDSRTCPASRCNWLPLLVRRDNCLCFEGWVDSGAWPAAAAVLLPLPLLGGKEGVERWAHQVVLEAIRHTFELWCHAQVPSHRRQECSSAWHASAAARATCCVAGSLKLCSCWRVDGSLAFVQYAWKQS
jgi:hypothetical protein